MALPATLKDTIVPRLNYALSQPNVSYIFKSSLEQDAKALLNTRDAFAGHYILGMLDVMQHHSAGFDNHFSFITNPDKPSVFDLYYLNGLNRLGRFDEATMYIRHILANPVINTELEFLKGITHFAMLYGFIDEAEKLLHYLKKMKAIDDKSAELEHVYLLLRETGIPQESLIMAILAAKQFISSKGLVIPAYSFGYNIEFDQFIELKILCFSDDLQLLDEVDYELSELLVDMEENFDHKLIHLCISCRPYNSSYGVGG